MKHWIKEVFIHSISNEENQINENNGEFVGHHPGRMTLRLLKLKEIEQADQTFYMPRTNHFDYKEDTKFEYEEQFINKYNYYNYTKPNDYLSYDMKGGFVLYFNKNY